jgi:hypothetical protein
LWRRNRALLIGFVFAVLVTLFFAVRLVVHAAYWSGHRDAELAEWMTIGYVAQSYGVGRDDLARAMGVEPGFGQRLNIAGIAERTHQSVNEVEEALLAAIRAPRAEDVISPRSGSTQHSLTIRAAQHMADLVDGPSTSGSPA